MYLNEKTLKEEVRQLKDEHISMILEQPTAEGVVMFDVYKFDNELFYNKKQIDEYLLKQIRNVFDTLGFD